MFIYTSLSIIVYNPMDACLCIIVYCSMNACQRIIAHSSMDACLRIIAHSSMVSPYFTTLGNVVVTKICINVACGKINIFLGLNKLIYYFIIYFKKFLLVLLTSFLSVSNYVAHIQVNQLSTQLVVAIFPDYCQSMFTSQPVNLMKLIIICWQARIPDRYFFLSVQNSREVTTHNQFILSSQGSQ